MKCNVQLSNVCIGGQGQGGRKQLSGAAARSRWQGADGKKLTGGKEQLAMSRWQGAGGKEQEARSRWQGAGGKEHEARSRWQGAGGKEQL